MTMLKSLCAAIATILVAALGAGCTNAAVDKAVGTADGTPEIGIERTAAGVLVANQAGRPVLNVRLEVDEFFHVVPALDAGAKREIRFAEFRTTDGTLLDPAVATPAQITLTARDTLGNTYEATVPW
jgi:hypothetical protein